MGEEVALSVFPSEKESIVIHNRELSRSGNIGPFITYTAFQDKKEYHFSVRDASSVNSDEESTLKRPVVGSPITSSKVVNARAVLQFEPDVFTGMKQVMLRIRYRGDIGYAFPTVKCSMIISVMELLGDRSATLQGKTVG